MGKDQIKLLFAEHPHLYQAASFFYTILKHPGRLMKTKSFGNKNPGQTVFLVRPNAEDGIQGLLSLAVQSFRWIDYAEKKGFEPVVDYLNYHTQYANGTDNVWDYYFHQPSDVTIQEAYESKRVKFSGVTFLPVLDTELFGGKVFSDAGLLSESRRILKEHLQLQDEVLMAVEKEKESLDLRHCIGVYLRGTDYIALKPSGEYVQPSVQEVQEQIDRFLSLYDDLSIFLVTEDIQYYNYLKSVYGDRLKTASFDSFVQDYQGGSFLSQSGTLDKNLKKRGMDYLVKTVMLSECGYLVSSIAKGSIFAYCLNQGTYEDEYVFNLGQYK